MMLVKNKTSKSEKVIISENIFENFFDKLNLFFKGDLIDLIQILMNIK